MSCNFCKHIRRQDFTQHCPKKDFKEIIYDESNNCIHYELDEPINYQKKEELNIKKDL